MTIYETITGLQSHKIKILKGENKYSLEITGSKKDTIYFELTHSEINNLIEKRIKILSSVMPLYPETEISIGEIHFYSTDLITNKNEFYCSTFVLEEKKWASYFSLKELKEIKAFLKV